MAIKTVALIGANGHLGPSILSALLSSSLKTSILSRQSSKSTYPANVPIITIPDDLPTDALIPALRGQDALVITMAGSRVAEQKRLIEAAWHAGVKRIIPAEFGSCDSADEKTLQLLPLMEGKRQVREFLKEWCAKPRSQDVGPLTWTALVTGHFFDYGLKCDLLKLDVRKRKAVLVDGGEIPFSATNLATIGRAVVKVLVEREEETKDRLLYIQSLRVTQKEVLEALERAMGAKWVVEERSSEELIAEARPKMLEGDAEALEEVVAVHGVVASDWKGKEDFANELLGLEEEDLNEIVKGVVKELS